MPLPSYPACVQHLCLDKGCDNATGRLETLINGYVPHIRRIGEEKFDSNVKKKHKARRWVVEGTIGCFSKCRGLLVRYEKKASNYPGFVQLDCIPLWFRRYHRLTVLG